MTKKTNKSQPTSKKPVTKRGRKTTGPSGPIDLKAVSSGHQAVYGDVLRKAIARGDVNEMRKVAAIARKWINDAQGALRNLEMSIKQLET